jgi:hypothetical protein
MVKPQTSDDSILQARAHAQHLAFGPVVFQAVRFAWKSGLLKAIDDADEHGASMEELERATALTPYALGVLLEITESAEVTICSSERHFLRKTGSMLLRDKMTQVNVDFIHDVCYKAMFYLDEALKTGKPAGLHSFSDADTIYEAMPTLPEKVQKSWYAFDHYYSDRAFKQAVRIVFTEPVECLLDIGGNTGNWTKCCLAHDDKVRVTIADLPGQLDKARDALKTTLHSERAAYFETDLLNCDCLLPSGFDVIWMSQFLDCFSEDQIAAILTKVRPALAQNGRVFIMETFVDRQRFEAATYSLNATSLYFAALANGNSRMYRSEVILSLLDQQGYDVANTHDDVGIGHTILECRLK